MTWGILRIRYLFKGWPASWWKEDCLYVQSTWYPRHSLILELNVKSMNKLKDTEEIHTEDRVVWDEMIPSNNWTNIYFRMTSILTYFHLRFQLSKIYNKEVQVCVWNIFLMHVPDLFHLSQLCFQSTIYVFFSNNLEGVRALPKSWLTGQ